VTPEEAIEELIRACPSFEPAWRTFLAEEYPDAAPGHEGRLPYVDVAGLSDQVVDCLANGRVTELPAYFAALEGLYHEAGPILENFLTIGVLESIQNIALGRNLELTAFIPWLGPRTLQEWDALIAFWEGRPQSGRAGAG
jgi:hypothetical protein